MSRQVGRYFISNQHIVFLYVTDICLLEVICSGGCHKASWFTVPSSALLRKAIAVILCDVSFFFFYTMCAETLSPRYILSPRLISRSKTLKSLLMPLVIFVNTILQLNSLDITVFVCYVSASKLNRKDRSRPFLFVCFYQCFTLQNKSLATPGDG